MRVWLWCFLVCLVGCSGGKLKVIETKVISESEPYTKADDDIVIMNTDMALKEETVRIYNWYDPGKEIRELADEDRATFCIISNLSDYLVFPVYGLEIPPKKLKRKDRLPYAIDILPGWAKDKKTFQRYNRPKRVRLEFYLVPFHNPNSQYEETYLIEEDFKLVYVLVSELTDEIGWQRLNIGIKPIEGYYLNPPLAGRLIIEDVYPGETDLTAISEIRFLYRETEK